MYILQIPCSRFYFSGPHKKNFLDPPCLLSEEPSKTALNCLEWRHMVEVNLTSLGVLGPWTLCFKTQKSVRDTTCLYVKKCAISREGLQSQSSLFLSQLQSESLYLPLWEGEKKKGHMGLYALRVLIILVCIGFIAVLPEKVSSSRSTDAVFRWNQEYRLAADKSHVLEGVSVKDMNTKKNTAPEPSTFDPNRSSKRKVRRGSDPIHNRSWNLAVSYCWL